ncbi:hypothetical protein PC129_g1729 [Phytophthora cactorum]|uniref:Uncharacterized protein n=1 Tax=Phytophthora cactorum TaxID=29920 RepID=A0A8T1IUB8_9STRA|nr:hypothetical protein PC111_g12674 [Phytophthora cactorum]KAG2852490.1 hypothetical protein PC113_g14978 [Phytophthora cactorum]KAG2893088.1 hypothetical protein PC114_g16373 [Phytophthora cactorum]KAG2912553.1 hypothetical protein PC115_g12293 [Phytophthora cactorum]KAG3012859.1 hypothetical protein PC120_g13605 [Phytophthora cactorum]
MFGQQAQKPTTCSIIGDSASGSDLSRLLASSGLSRRRLQLAESLAAAMGCTWSRFTAPGDLFLHPTSARQQRLPARGDKPSNSR